MANKLYNVLRTLLVAPSGASGGAGAGGVTVNTNVNFLTDDLRLILVETTGGATNYTFAETHTSLADVPAGARVQTQALSPSGRAHSNLEPAPNGLTLPNVTFSALPAGTYEALVLYKHTGATEANCPLLVYYDVVTGLPFTATAGANLEIVWNTGNGKALRIG
jgi:hypothetical protein